ncbi:hypothetical protein E4U32_007624 [Claviceps aff. humidiphila group G2b]|nr:hypothetical protein E4U32_007624 [Claviceps aff. humidiphila group G2b]
MNRGDQPLVRPVYWEYPALAKAFENPNGYYFGSDVVVALIVEPRSALYEGYRQMQMFRSLETIPVPAPEGFILPLD